MNVFSAGQGDAPGDAGVYFFLGADTELLYVGKATSLRKRLAQHARAAQTAVEPRLKILYERVAEIRWEPLGDEVSASAREADIIVALRPRFNASHVDQGRWNYIVVAPVERTPDTSHFTLTDRTPASATSAYGCFPHLGHGVSSRPAIACSDGYTTLLRLLWVSSSPGAGGIPSALARGRLPDAFKVRVRGSWRTLLHALLSGTSSRLLRELSALDTTDAPHLALGLARDHAAAMSFFRFGPAALRQLRLRHGGRASLATRARIEEWVAVDLRAAIGDFKLPTPCEPSARHLGRRSHPWAT